MESDGSLFTYVLASGTIFLIPLLLAVLALAGMLWALKRRLSRSNLKHMLDALAAENRELKARIHLFSTTLDNVTFPVWQRNSQLSVISYNASYDNLLKENPEDRSVGLYGRAGELAQKARDGGEAQTIRKHIIVGGDRRLYQITEVPAEGGTIGFARDITDIEEIETELQKHIAVQSDLLESSASAIAIYGADTRLRYFNNAFVNLWKLEERWLAGNPTFSEITETLRENRKLPEQSDFQSFKKNALAMFTNLLEKHEEYYYLPDGRVLRVIVIPHEMGGLLFSYEDMTDYIALERSYNTLISVKKSTIDNLYEGVAAFGEDGRLQLSNPVYADMWELDDAVLQSNPHISAILEETKHFYDYGNDWESFKKSIIVQAGKHVSYRQRLFRKDSSVLDWSCVPLPDGATLMTYMDVTDSYRVEESLRAEKKALEEADSVKNKFLANVSYELRSPLTSIIGFTEMLLQGHFGAVAGKQEEYLRDILESSLLLNALIDNVLDIVSIDAGFVKLEATEFDIYKMFSAVVDEAMEKTGGRNITLHLNCDPAIGRMTGDEKRLRQAMRNLIHNALRFMQGKGQIIVSVQASEENVVITVEDSGSGIAQEHSHAQDGAHIHPETGLSLTITKSIIQLHGGYVSTEFTQRDSNKVTCVLNRHARIVAQVSEPVHASL